MRRINDAGGKLCRITLYYLAPTEVSCLFCGMCLAYIGTPDLCLVVYPQFILKSSSFGAEKDGLVDQGCMHIRVILIQVGTGVQGCCQKSVIQIELPANCRGKDERTLTHGETLIQGYD